MKTQNILLASLLLFVLSSCKPEYGKILEAQKQTIFAGQKNAPNHIRYTLKFELYKPVSIEEFGIEKGENKTILEHFVLKNTNTGQKLLNTKKIPPGSYSLTTSIIAGENLHNEKETLYLKISIPGKKKTYLLTTPVKQGKPVFMP